MPIDTSTTGLVSRAALSIAGILMSVAPFVNDFRFSLMSTFGNEVASLQMLGDTGPIFAGGWVLPPVLLLLIGISVAGSALLASGRTMARLAWSGGAFAVVLIIVSSVHTKLFENGGGTIAGFTATARVDPDVGWWLLVLATGGLLVAPLFAGGGRQSSPLAWRRATPRPVAVHPPSPWLPGPTPYPGGPGAGFGGFPPSGYPAPGAPGPTEGLLDPSMAPIPPLGAALPAGPAPAPRPPVGPPPGWFPDNAAPGRLRWWDGSRWTEHTHPA